MLINLIMISISLYIIITLHIFKNDIEQHGIYKNLSFIPHKSWEKTYCHIRSRILISTLIARF